MRKMKDSGIEWIGEIPTTWELRRLRFLCDIQTGNMDTQNNNPDGKYPFYVRSPKIEHSDSYTFDNEAVLMAGDGVGAGKVFHYVSGKYGCHQRVYSMSDFAEVNGKYLYYYLSENFYKKIEESNAKSTVDSVRLPMLKDFVVAFPKKDEQEKIVTYLNEKSSKIDAIIEKQQAVIGKLKEYKLSIITETVTLGLNKDVDLKDSQIAWIGHINNDYSLSRVGAFSFVTKLAGFEYTDTMVNAISPDEIIPIVRAQNVRMFKFNDNNISEYIGEDISKSLQRCALDKKAVLITFIGAGIGDVCIFDKENRHHLAPNVAKIEIRDEFKNILLEEFLMYYLGSYAGKGEIQKISKASAQPSLSMGTIRGIKIVLPPIEEQYEIVSYLDEKCKIIDILILRKEEEIKKLSEYKKSLIYEVVTGKKEV